MQIDIPAHIEKLLFLHDTLVIPSFGGFTASRVPATADYVGGTVSPASKTLAFSENLTIDDGILVNDIANTHGLSTEDARNAVQDFVEKMQVLLSQREIVTLPAVGRLYKNYMQKIQFLPDATNFNAESFGLPPLQFSPIARSREVQESTPVAVSNGVQTPSTTPAPPPPPVSTPPPPIAPYYTSDTGSGGSTVLTILGVLVLLGALVAGIWWWRNKPAPKDVKTVDQTEQVVEDITDHSKTTPKINKPLKEEAPATIDEKAKASVDQKMKEARQELQQESKTGRECILIIATLKEKTNADRLVGILENAGYKVYFMKTTGYQVGIQFRYKNLSEVQQKMEALEKLTGESQIWIKKK